MYSETFMNWLCSKAGTFLRSTDTFYLVCFLHVFLSHISKAKTVKRTLLQTFFYTLKQQCFFISFCSFERVQHFWLELCIFYSKLLSASNQQLFCITESDIRQGPSNHTAPLYELLVSVYWFRLTLSFGKMSKTYRRMH